MRSIWPPRATSSRPDSGAGWTGWAAARWRIRRRVLCIEWLEPLYLAGHWVPELVEVAGGTDVGARPGAHSARTTWEAATALRPNLILIMLCGLESNVGEELTW